MFISQNTFCKIYLFSLLTPKICPWAVWGFQYTNIWNIYLFFNLQAVSLGLSVNLINNILSSILLWKCPHLSFVGTCGNFMEPRIFKIVFQDGQNVFNERILKPKGICNNTWIGTKRHNITNFSTISQDRCDIKSVTHS